MRCLHDGVTMLSTRQSSPLCPHGQGSLFQPPGSRPLEKETGPAAALAARHRPGQRGMGSARARPHQTPCARLPSAFGSPFFEGIVPTSPVPGPAPCSRSPYPFCSLKLSTLMPGYFFLSSLLLFSSHPTTHRESGGFCCCRPPPR